MSTQAQSRMLMETAAAVEAHNDNNAVPRSLMTEMAHRFGMEPGPFEATLRGTVVKGAVSREELAAFLLVCREYSLNPVLKEIHGLPAKGGGIIPYIGIDGWSRIVNAHPAMNGMEFVDIIDEDTGELTAITCTIRRKDRDFPTTLTEYMAECRKPTEPWRERPRRMLRHKSMMQCARYAFGFSNLYDYEEAQVIAQGRTYSTAAPPLALTSEFSEAGPQTPSTEPEEPIHEDDYDLPAIDEEDEPEDVAVWVEEPEPELPTEPETPPVDLMAWVSVISARLLSYADVDALRDDWSEHKDALKTEFPSAFRALNRAVAEQAEAIAKRTAK